MFFSPRTQLIAVVVISAVLVCTSQLIIPKRQLGYVYNGASNDALIHLDAHFGPLCPDSREAFPTLKQVADHYGRQNLKLTLHMFPLPYHHQAYLTAIGAQAVRKLGSGDSTAYNWFQSIYSNLDKFSNDNTANLTTNDVIRQLATVASSLGIQLSAFLQAMMSEELELNTRAAWKYSCSRSVSGTPTFFLNDVPLDADPTWTLSDWERVIDPLLNDVIVSPVNKDCPVDTQKCEYLPHKVECCTKGEACIPNVGCRCFENGCLQDCPSGTKKCEYLPHKTECCTKGEACIPNVGCRCFGNGCLQDCPAGTKKCEYLPHKTECCTTGEACIPDVGCRCFGNGCEKPLKFLKEIICPLQTTKCEYDPGRYACCSPGQSCVPHRGCRSGANAL